MKNKQISEIWSTTIIFPEGLEDAPLILCFLFSILDDVPMSIIEDSAQLVKANSISGNKMNDIDVVYTLWSNLKKTEGMVVGQVQIFNFFCNF